MLKITGGRISIELVFSADDFLRMLYSDEPRWHTENIAIHVRFLNEKRKEMQLLRDHLERYLANTEPKEREKRRAMTEQFKLKGYSIQTCPVCNGTGKDPRRDILQPSCFDYCPRCSGNMIIQVNYYEKGDGND